MSGKHSLSDQPGVHSDGGPERIDTMNVHCPFCNGLGTVLENNGGDDPLYFPVRSCPMCHSSGVEPSIQEVERDLKAAGIDCTAAQERVKNALKGRGER